MVGCEVEKTCSWSRRFAETPRLPSARREQQEASLVPFLGGVHLLQKTKGHDGLVDLLKHLRHKRAD